MVVGVGSCRRPRCRRFLDQDLLRLGSIILKPIRVSKTFGGEGGTPRTIRFDARRHDPQGLFLIIMLKQFEIEGPQAFASTHNAV